MALEEGGVHLYTRGIAEAQLRLVYACEQRLGRRNGEPDIPAMHKTMGVMNDRLLCPTW